MSMARLLLGDVFDRMAELPDASVDLVLTSPPFLALRSYLPADHPDKAKEIGSEPTPAVFLDTLLALTAEWRRVLAPHGSICVELGDTYAGGNGFDIGGNGWPLAKSLCGIPHLYHLSLAYGRNLLTGEPSPAGSWRVRNVVAWCRPNPPVGALGDKFRPGTSYMTVACVSGSRYFDLDAVRDKTKPPNTQPRAGVKEIANPDRGTWNQGTGDNPAGAPPLDWWEIPTQPYAGAHYATWPAALCERPVKAMCPRRVCTTCGKPSTRITGEAEYVRHDSRGLTVKTTAEAPPAFKAATDGLVKPQQDSLGHVTRHTPTLGWSDCGHGSYRCSTCHVLVPSDHAIRRPSQGTRGEAQVSEEGILDEPIQVSGEQAQHAGDLRALRGGVHGSPGSQVLHPELFGEAGTQGGPSQHARAANQDAGHEEDPGRVRPHLGSDGHAGPAEERLHDGTPAGDAGTPGTTSGPAGDRASSQRGEGRQPAGEPRGGDEDDAPRDGDLSSLPEDVRGQLADGYVCPCGSTDVEYVADHWRNGLVLDPFAGSGTTLAVATGHGRDAVGIDLDPRNAQLCAERVGLFLDIEDHPLAQRPPA